MPNKQITLTKRHHFKGDAATFKLFPGAHKLDLQINGKIHASTSFELVK